MYELLYFKNVEKAAVRYCALFLFDKLVSEHRKKKQRIKEDRRTHINQESDQSVFYSTHHEIQLEYSGGM